MVLVLTDDAGITDIHARFLGDSRPTDVISFRYDPMPGSDECVGELFVNAERAAAAASRIGGDKRRWTVADELALYAAHGFDHLSGADDASPAERRRMRRRELRWLREARGNDMIHQLLES